MIFFIFCLTFFSCNKKKDKNEQNILVKENRTQETQLEENTKKEKGLILNKDSVWTNENLVQGVWAETKNENALFYINKDSLYYIDNQVNPFHFEIKSDTIFVFGDILSKLYLVKLTKDSLWYKTDFYDEMTKLYKRPDGADM